MKSAATRRPTQAERREESEARLLKAAAQLIASEGYAAATFDRIGQIAGYSRGLASQKFGDKEGLVRAVIAFILAQVERATTARMAEARTPTQAILAYAEAILNEIEEDHVVRAFWVMMAAAITNRLPFQHVFLDAHERVKEQLSALIAQGQAEGAIPAAIDSDAGAITIGSTLLGIGVECMLDPNLDIARVRRSTLVAISAALSLSNHQQ